MSQGGQKTGRERVVAAYKGEFADCVPAYPIAGSFAGCLDGLSIEEYCTNPKKATKAMINYYERYQPDIMVAFNDLAKEVEAVGCHVKYSDYVVPSIDEHVLQDDKGLLARLEVPDPFRAGRIPGFLEQCEALSAQKFPSGLGAVLVGPWTIAMLMRNPELMCLDTLDDPEFVHELMRFATEYAKRFGDAVLTTKIGLVVLGPDGLLLAGRPRHLSRVHQALPPGPRELLQGQEGRHHGPHLRHDPPDPRGPGRRRLRGHHDRSRPAVRSRAAGGPARPAGDARQSARRGGYRQRRRHHLRARRARAEIEAEVRRCLDTVGKRSRFVLSTSCELPPRANPDCVKWFMDAAREYGRVEPHPGRLTSPTRFFRRDVFASHGTGATLTAIARDSRTESADLSRPPLWQEPCSIAPPAASVASRLVLNRGGRHMATRSRCRPSGRTFAALAMLLVVAVLPPNIPAVRGAEPMFFLPFSMTARRLDVTRSRPRSATRRRRRPPHPRAAASARRRAAIHAAGARPGPAPDEPVYGTTWIKMAIPAGSTFPHRRWPGARSLPGVLKATKDIVVSINDQIPPRDPIYKNDDDPFHEALRPLLRDLRSLRRWSISGASSRWKPRTRGGSPAAVRTSSSRYSTVGSRSTTTI